MRQREAQRCGEWVMSEKVCKILLRPSPPAWGTPSRRGICDVDFYLLLSGKSLDAANLSF